MRAVGSSTLPAADGDDVAYEMKWDGFRAVVWRTAESIRIQSRQGTDLTRFFPDLVGPLTAGLPPRTVVDGEVLVWDTERGRCSFSLLQRRLTAGRRLAQIARRHPAHLVAFDLLRDGRGTELLDLPLTARRAKLDRLLHAPPPQLVLCPQTLDRATAERWLGEVGVAGVEGVVVKPVAHRYRPGTAGWMKVRLRDTADYVVGGITGTMSWPVTLLLGRYDRQGVLRYAGQTHPIAAGQRRDLTAALQAVAFQGAGSGHPWPCPLPAAWSTGLSGTQPVPYTPVEPTLVAEVEVDTAVDGPFSRLRHGCRHARIRLDLRSRDIVLDEPEPRAYALSSSR
jgi:ATP-dependent DNA ligase